jgi:hypothetical protein
MVKKPFCDTHSGSGLDPDSKKIAYPYPGKPKLSPKKKIERKFMLEKFSVRLEASSRSSMSSIGFFFI